MSEPEIVKAPFKRSAESERLYNRLMELGEGAFVAYRTVAELIDEDPQRGAGYAIVKGVRERLVKEESIVWFVIPSAGIQRATAVEMIEISDGNLKGIGRKLTRTARISNSAGVQYGSLSAEGKREYNYQTSILGALKQFFVREKQQVIRDRVKEATLDCGEVLKLFGRSK